ncbi:MAG: hypothetical protein JXL80_15200 [Planctomycetes bacterium]|nr:hypothetical protein [Planctomycetota bacterium]
MSCALVAGASVLVGVAPLSVVAVLMVAAALGVALLLLGSASRRLKGAAGSLRRPSSLDLVGLRTELKSNYNRLRRSGEAMPLAADVWRRFTASGETMPLAVRREVAQAYHAIDVSNRLLTASTAYDSRGILSIRQRRLALWPTLETAIRGALVALGCDVAPAVQVHARPFRQPDATVKPAATAAPTAPVAVAPESVAVAAVPKLSLFYGVEEPASVAEHRDGSARTAAAKSKRRTARPQRHAADGQMPLWESVA